MPLVRKQCITFFTAFARESWFALAVESIILFQPGPQEPAFSI